MLSEIGSWRRHENSVRFVGSGPREEGPISLFSVVADTNKHYAVYPANRSCPRGVNLVRMWRVQRLDRINGQKPSQSGDSRSLTLKFRSTRIGRFL